MSRVAFTFNNGTITLIAGAKAHQVTASHPSYARIKALLAKADNEQAILDLLNVQQSLASVSNGQFVVKDGQVFYGGQPVHNAVTQRISQFMQEGLPFDRLVLFLEKLMKNPSYKSREDLYDFLEHRGLPITEDGDFLAYKAVKENWFDKYTGTIDNSIGREITMDRGAVDDNHDNHCSKGLHCGAMDYVTQYGGGDDRIVIVKVNPADAISVPRDANFMKLRVCRYVVVKEYEGDLNRALYTNHGEDVDYGYDEDDDQDWLDEIDEAEDEDDSFDEGEVQSHQCNDCGSSDVDTIYGTKPNGQRFHNVRDAHGHFTKRSN
jgi:hypothetical protein